MVRCAKCGYKIRGDKHEEGRHHTKGEKGHIKEDQKTKRR
uniref:Uncharacterized protein n=1 Tax=viral metagenome TaxID=1070528 RepID=A0A6M3KV16_9ZZZZ